MLPGITASDTSEALPNNPHAGDEVVAINSGGAHNYTLTGTIDGVSNLTLAHGDAATLIYTSGGWLSVTTSGGGSGGGVTLQTGSQPWTPDTGGIAVTGLITTGPSPNASSNTGGVYISTTGGNVTDTVFSITNPADENSFEVSADGSTTITIGSPSGATGLTISTNASDAIDVNSPLGEVLIGRAGGTGKLSLVTLIGASHTDGATTTRITFADTNTATTLSNACIAFVPQAGAAGRLGIFSGGTDNDTPGAFEVFSADGDGTAYVNFPALGGSQGDFIFQVGGKAYFDGQSSSSGADLRGHDLLNGGEGTFANLIANSGGLTVAGNIALGGNTITGFGAALNLGNNGITNAGIIAGAQRLTGLSDGTGGKVSWSDMQIWRSAANTLAIGNVAGAGTIHFYDDGAADFANGGITFDQLDQIIISAGTGSGGVIAPQIAINQAALGSHQLDVTGDVGITTDLYLFGIAAAAGVAGKVYADPITHALFVSV